MITEVQFVHCYALYWTKNIGLFRKIVGCLTGYKVEVVASLAKKDLTPDMTR